MSGGNIQTEIDMSRLPEEDREAARRYLKRKGQADLIPILGLDDTPIRSSRKQRDRKVQGPAKPRTKPKIDLDTIERNPRGDRA